MNRKNGIGPWAAFVITFVLVLAIGFGALRLISGSGTEHTSAPVAEHVQEVKKAVTEKAVETAVQQATGSDVTLEEVKERLSPEDREKLDTVIAHLAEQGILAEAVKALAGNGGDLISAALALQSKVSAEDQEILFSLYQTYGDDLLAEFQEAANE